MKLIRYIDEAGTIKYGSVADDGAAYEHGTEGWGEPTQTVARIQRYLPPIQPSVIIGIGLNYRAHAEETKAKLPDHPVVFYKNPWAACGHQEEILLPRTRRSDKVDFECELAVVIGKACRNATVQTAYEFVAGYTCANDISARDWQKEWGGGQWSLGKSFDTFCPLGPSLVTPDEIPDPHRLAISTRLNGQTMQESRTSDLIFDIPTLIQFLSGDMTLLPGTVILTGTPHGVGAARTPPVWLREGDRVEVTIEGIGTLSNRVTEAI